MTDYTPKHGDTVTVAGADGEWTTDFDEGSPYVWVIQGTAALRVLPSMLTLVPTVPPEPAVRAGNGDKPQPGDRVIDGGEPGVIVHCETCDGQGVLHKPDRLPDVVRAGNGDDDE